MRCLNKFDRRATKPPEYLCQLRSKGHWRMFNVGLVPDAQLLSSALKTLYTQPHLLPQDRNVFLDAGCGHSPDAHLARKVLGFKEAFKVDLWPPYCYDADDFFLKRMHRVECGKVRFIQGDICELSSFVDPESIDAIGCNAMIDLIPIPDRRLFYEEACKVLAPGGVLSINRVPLAAGYGGWHQGPDYYAELKTMREAGFSHVNSGLVNSIVLRKPSPQRNVPFIERYRRAGSGFMDPMLDYIERRDESGWCAYVYKDGRESIGYLEQETSNRSVSEGILTCEKGDLATAVTSA